MPKATSEIELIIMLMYAEIMRELLAFMKNMQRILGLTIQEVVKKQMTLMYMCFETKLKNM